MIQGEEKRVLTTTGMLLVRLPDIHVRCFEFTGVKLRWPHRLQVCVPGKLTLHLLAISDPTDNKLALPGNERSRGANSDKAQITSGRITMDGRARRMIVNASSAVFAFPLIIR